MITPVVNDETFGDGNGNQCRDETVMAWQNICFVKNDLLM